MTTGQADIDAVLDDILDLDLDSFDVTVCLASCGKDEPVPQYQILQLFGELADEFRRVVNFNLVKWKRDRSKSNLFIRPYSAESKPEQNEVEYMNLDLPEFDAIKAQIEPLITLAGIEVFQEEDAFIDNLRFYVIILQAQGADPIYFFRSYTQKRMLERSRLFAISATHGQYNKVKIATFLFDYEVDCISQGNTMLIYKKDNFQEMFRYFEMLRKFAREILDNIKTRDFIQNFEQFKIDCEGHLQKLAKLKNIAAKPYWKRITIENIKNVNQKRNLGVKIEYINGKEMVVYDPGDKWKLLKLLDDDFLWSEMTELGYEVNGKRELHQ